MISEKEKRHDDAEEQREDQQAERSWSASAGSLPRVVRSWQRGLPPKDGNTYEARRRCRSILNGRVVTPVWSPYCWWNGKTYVERNQFTGGERWVDLWTGRGHWAEWRESPNITK